MRLARPEKVARPEKDVARHFPTTALAPSQAKRRTARHEIAPLGVPTQSGPILTPDPILNFPCTFRN